ncbi:hypothetical protein FPZ42_07670 [Mucilaginibacter achroorhodeus]|uniref:Uncharacterized protein n=1 Tax=Mucilaginibacter achroorhodeus TaxID=2599294 RepID=A0A563U6G0_9SPHI|nr:hypothetical protein [Mucilaginibacter achroorhodeus]TWR26904.1 hypothetical protein FPZ42_07670 [Mucilaginibacter achroorhodeus]
MANGGGNSQQSNVLINISVTGQEEVSQAQQQVKNLNQSAQQAGQVNMAAPAKTLKQELREATNQLQRMLAAGQQNTREYTETARRVADIRNQIDETRNSIKALDPDNKFRVLGNAATFGAKAVQGYAGALTFLGVESGTATETIAKLQGIMAFADAIDSVNDLKDTWRDLGRILGLSKAATQEQTVATQVNNTVNAETAIIQEASAVATGAQALAMEGSTVATEAATVATTGFGLALKAIGIGLIISALAYLITNWEKVKTAVEKLFPSLGKTGGILKEITQVVFGVGNAILQYLITPIKVLIDVIQGDFTAAMNDIKSGFDIVQNYKDGAAAKAKEQAEEERKERVKKEIEANERIIKERKALGQSIYDLEVKNQKLRIATLDKDDKEYAKNKADAESELTVLVNTEAKRRKDEADKIAKAAADKAAQLRKADLDSIKKNNDDALKIIRDGSKDARTIELNDLDVKYKKEFALLEKRKRDIKDYNVEYANLVTARKLEEQKINKKYSDAIAAYDDEVNQAYFTEFEKKAAEINKKADDLLAKGVTPKERASVEADRNFQLSRNTEQETATANSQKANANLVNAENANRPSPTDTPDEAAAKITAIEKAKLDAENAAYALKQTQVQGQYDAEQELLAQHTKALGDITADGVNARIELDKKEREAKLATYEAIGGGLASLSGLVGDQTVAGKAMAVAAATIDTYVGANKAFAQGGVLGFATAASVIAAGLLNVKKIVSTKIPTTKGDSSNTGSFTAPIINSTVITRQNNGTKDLTDAVATNNDNQKPLRAYIVAKDLDNQRDSSTLGKFKSTY